MSAHQIRKSEVETKLIGLVEPVLHDLGYELRDIEVTTGQGAVVRLVLDRPVPREPAIGIDDCQRVHQVLSPMFDVWDPIPTNYNLELSSPGESPSLRTLEHFQEAVGHKVHFQTVEAMPMPAPAKPRKNWESQLVEVTTAGEIVVEDSFGRHTVQISLIKNAEWIRDWSLRSEKPKGGSKKARKEKNA